MFIRYAAATEKGLARALNEDAYMVVPEDHLFLVADGMGGHALGEVASRLAVRTIGDFLKQTRVPGDHIADTALEKVLERRLVQGIKAANEHIRDRASAWHVGSMGTTVVGAVCYDDEALIAHVGDSRCYRIREGSIAKLTEDHSLRNAILRAMDLGPDDPEPQLPNRNLLIRALGADQEVEVDVLRDTPEPGDVYLLCSDGLYEALDDAEMLRIVEENRDDLKRAARLLVDAAVDAEEPDDITAVLVAYDPTVQ